MIDKITEKVMSKIVQARYDIYLYYWNIGDDKIKEHNANLKPNEPIWATVSEAYHYYLKAWLKEYALEK